MSLLQNPRCRRSWKFLLQLKYSPAPAPASASPGGFRLNRTGVSSDITQPLYSILKVSHLGVRLLQTQSVSCPQLHVQARILFPPRLSSSHFLAIRNFSSAEAVTASAEECGREFSDTACVTGEVNSPEDNTCVIADQGDRLNISSMEEDDDNVVKSSVNVSGGSSLGGAEDVTKAEVDGLRKTVETHAQQLDLLRAEVDRLQQSAVGRVKESEYLSVEVDRLKKIAEDQRQLLDFLRAEVDGYKAFNRPVVQQGNNLQSFSTKEEEDALPGLEKRRELLEISGLSKEENMVKQIEEGVATVITKDGGESHEITVQPSWPEWTQFLEHLSSLNFFKDEHQRVAEGRSIFDDAACIKRAFYKFSQAYETIFESLSRKDLQVLAQYGCPSDDRRTVASGKRLRNYFQIEEKSVCDPCPLQSSCESAHVKPANVHPKFSDVLRLLFSIGLNASPQKGALPDDVESSVLRLFQEIISLSAKHEDAKPRSEGLHVVLDSSRQVKGKVNGLQESSTLEKVETAKEDQHQEAGGNKLKPSRCSQDEVPNRGKPCTEENREVVKDKKDDSDQGLGKVEGATAGMKAADWKCSRCLFMNAAHKNRCVECSLRRPEDTNNKANRGKDSTEKCSDALGQTDEDGKLTNDPRTNSLKDCVDKRRSRKGKNDGGRQGVGGRLSSFVKESESSEIDEVSTDSAEDENLDIFDDIVEAEDSGSPPENQSGSTRKNTLSDLVEENFDAFAPRRGRDRAGSDRRDDGGTRRLRGRGNGDVDYDSGVRRTSRRDNREDVWDSDDSDFKRNRSGRGNGDFNSRDGRRDGRSIGNEYRGRGGGRGEYGGGRGGRGYRGGSYDDDNYSRRSDRGERGNRSYDGGRYSENGWEDRGSRSGRDGDRGRGAQRGRGRGRSGDRY